ncbi:aspartate kinase [Thermodesulfomicrobium sp. WS]|uniref:aspartate kinase n=1 Tax=Thermodesulfomicrobium sp. WS TaxID=3004129 RepID=UPI00248FBBA4|nr:aspartate kinase [Thermodesulfomicrobium sp. WS]BDV01516.1 aspartate kinase [Thermodesulfomicrobium sp. WS]
MPMCPSPALPQRALRVEKIGGTTMSRFAEVIDNVILRNPDDIYGRIYVVSAYGGVTNRLLEHKKTGEPGVYTLFKNQGNYIRALLDLRDHLCEINASFAPIGLNLAVADEFIADHIDLTINILRSMENVLASGYVSRTELLLAARELLASIGEMHSAFNSTNILQNRGYDATFVDLSGWEDSRQLTIDERIRESFQDIDPFRTICFATGYTKGTEGIMREFDRGYSEVTFSKVAVILGAAEAVIHKEYHLCSGDPLIIGLDKIRPVCNTNFDVADQLADVGMEAIHPKASKPLEIRNIPIRVKNAFDPDHAGTLITKDFIAPRSKVEIVTGSAKVTCIEIHDTRMVGEVGFDLRIMQVLAAHGVSFICKATNANTIDVIINDRDCQEALLADLRARFEQVQAIPVAIVCAIGSNIAQPGILAKAANALAKHGINILAMSQTVRQTNMQFVVEREHFATAQRALHESLCM